MLQTEINYCNISDVSLLLFNLHVLSVLTPIYYSNYMYKAVAHSCLVMGWVGVGTSALSWCIVRCIVKYI